MVFVIDGFSDVEELAEGGSSRIYRGTWNLSNEPVAIKVADTSKHSKAIKLVKTEAETQYKLSNPEKPHPDIVKVISSGNMNGDPWFSMELMERSLKDVLENGRLPLDKALGYLEEMLGGLDTAHQNGIVHGDIKPANISDKNTLRGFLVRDNLFFSSKSFLNTQHQILTMS